MTRPSSRGGESVATTGVNGQAHAWKRRDDERPAPRRGFKSAGGNNSPSGLYPCHPGGPNDWVYITTSRANPEHWTRLMRLIGREELIEDPRYATSARPRWTPS